MMMHYPFHLTEPQPHLPNAIAVATATALAGVDACVQVVDQYQHTWPIRGWGLNPAITLLPIQH